MSNTRLHPPTIQDLLAVALVLAESSLVIQGGRLISMLFSIPLGNYYSILPSANASHGGVPLAQRTNNISILSDLDTDTL